MQASQYRQSRGPLTLRNTITRGCLRGQIQTIQEVFHNTCAKACRKSAGLPPYSLVTEVDSALCTSSGALFRCDSARYSELIRRVELLDRSFGFLGLWLSLQNFLVLLDFSFELGVFIVL